MGEDAAYFDVAQQSTGKWAFFTAELAIVLGIMYVVSAIRMRTWQQSGQS